LTSNRWRRRAQAALAGAAVLTAVALPAAAADVRATYAPPIVLPGHCGGEPSLAAGAKGLVIVTGRGDSCAATNGPVEVWVSQDGGRTFGPRQPVGPQALGNYDSDVAVDESTGTAYVAQGGGLSISVCQSKDRGQTWQAAPAGVEPCDGPIVSAGTSALLLDRPWVLARDGVVYLGYSVPLPLQNPVGLNKVTQTPMWLRSQNGVFVPLPPVTTAGGDLAVDSLRTFASRPALGPDGSIHQLLETASPSTPTPVCLLWAVSLAPGAPSWTATKLFDGCAAGVNLDGPNDGWSTLAADAVGGLYGVVTGNLGAGSGAHAYLVSSRDGGRSWRGPRPLGSTRSAYERPAAVAQKAGKLTVGWYRADAADPAAATARWVYEIGRITDPFADRPQIAGVAVSGAIPVHSGALRCDGCTANDLSTLAVDDHGCALLAYEDDRAVTPGSPATDASASDSVVRESDCSVTRSRRAPWGPAT